jgi:hypothetical protein
LEETVRFALMTGVLLIGLAGSPASAQSPAGAPDAARTLEELKALEVAVEAAFQKADAAFLDSVLAPDFQFWTAAGKPIARPQVLTTYGQPGRYPVRRQTAFDVELHGDVALSNGRLEVKSTVPREYIVCYIRLYQRLGGRWQLVSHRTFRERDGLTETCAPMDR